MTHLNIHNPWRFLICENVLIIGRFLIEIKTETDILWYVVILISHDEIDTNML